MNAPYDVGYGKPPIKSQFKKGKSGNPRGRPKTTLELVNYETSLIEQLKAPVTVIENGEKKTITQSQAVLKSYFAQAIKGDKAAAKDILENWRKLPPHAFDDGEVIYYRINKERRMDLEALARELDFDISELDEPPAAGAQAPEIGASVAKADTMAVCDGKPVVDDRHAKKA